MTSTSSRKRIYACTIPNCFHVAKGRKDNIKRHLKMHNEAQITSDLREEMKDLQSKVKNKIKSSPVKLRSKVANPKQQRKKQRQVTVVKSIVDTSSVGKISKGGRLF